LVELLWRDGEQDPSLLLRTRILGSVLSLNADSTSVLHPSAGTGVGKAVPHALDRE